MASDTQYIVGQVQARERVVAWLRLTYPDRVMPQFLSTSRYGREFVNFQNWKILADWLAEIAQNTADKLERLSREELLELASESGINVVGTGRAGYITRADLVKAIQGQGETEPEAKGELPFVAESGDSVSYLSDLSGEEFKTTATPILAGLKEGEDDGTAIGEGKA